jgi:hypothetical protein
VADNVVPPFAETLERQHSVMSRHQLLAYGIDDATMTRRVRSGEWQRPASAVYVLEPTPLGTEQRRIAASLYLGDQCQLTGPAALHWYGFRHVPSTDRVHALVPHASRRRSTGMIVVMRTEELDDRARDAGLYRLTSPARAVVDAGRVVGDLRAVRALFAEAVQTGHTDLDAIEHELRRAKRSRTAIANRAFHELVDGVRSSPEAELRNLIRSDRSLPPILWNPILATQDGTRLPSPDAYFADVAIAIEVDSREHHTSDEDFQRTLERANALSRFGILVLHFTPAEIRTSPSRVLRMIRDVYRQRSAQPVSVPVRAARRQ